LKIGSSTSKISTVRQWLYLLVLLLGIAAGACACGSNPNGSASQPSGASNATVQNLLKQGITQAQANMLGQATTTFKDVLQLSPKDTYAFYNLGLIEQQRHDTIQALSYYDQAISSDQTYTPALYNKAILLEATDLNSALALYQQIVKINPKASTAYLRMAFVYAEQGNDAQAQAARTKAIALDSSLAKYPLPAKCSPPNC